MISMIKYLYGNWFNSICNKFNKLYKKYIMEQVLGSAVYIVVPNHVYSVHISTRNPGNKSTLKPII